MSSAQSSVLVEDTPGLGRDFDLHGIVGLRLVDATDADIATVRRQLGPLQRPLDREPDIVVRFVDRIDTTDPTYVTVGAAAWDEKGFLLLRRSGTGTARARIPFADIGSCPEVVCERAMPAVPHLLAMINLIALGKGVLPLHATAFTLDGCGILVTGWSKAGKTECLLDAMRYGADYVGDEWVYLTSEGEMYGLPEPIRLWSWHLHQLPDLLRARSRPERARLRSWHLAGAAATRLAASRMPGAGLLRKGAPAVTRQAYLQIPPHDLFGARAVALRGRLDALVLVVNHESPDTTVTAVSGREVARRMAASLSVERAPFMADYLQFRYAFPDAASKAVETAETLEADLLSRVLAGRRASTVGHPYPCDIAELGRAVRSAVGSDPVETAVPGGTGSVDEGAS